MRGGGLGDRLGEEKRRLEVAEGGGRAPEEPAQARQALPGYMPQM